MNPNYPHQDDPTEDEFPTCETRITLPGGQILVIQLEPQTCREEESETSYQLLGRTFFTRTQAHLYLMDHQVDDYDPVWEVWTRSVSCMVEYIHEIVTECDALRAEALIEDQEEGR